MIRVTAHRRLVVVVAGDAVVVIVGVTTIVVIVVDYVLLFLVVVHRVDIHYPLEIGRLLLLLSLYQDCVLTRCRI